ncbi:MAG: PAS domain S-box protein [Limisphaerales bacterium]
MEPNQPSPSDSEKVVGRPRSSRLTRFLRYGLAVGAIAAAMGLRQALTAWVGPGLPTYVTFYPALVAVALLGGLGPGLLATALTDLVVDFWILPPTGQFAIASPVDRLGLVIFTGMGAFISVVFELYRRDRRKAAEYDREAAVRESRARLAVFAEATFEGIVESEAGRILDCNEQFARLSGYSVAELRGMEIPTLMVPEDRDRVMANIREGRDSSIEHALVRKDGTRIVVETHGRPVSPGSARRHTAIRDVTERKRAEEALRESLERLDLALISSRMATFDWDIVQDKRTWSDGVHNLLGTNPAAFTGAAEEFLQVIHPEDRSAVKAALTRAVETGHYETEYRAIWPDGTIRHISARGKVHRDSAGRAVQMTGICWDITERKQAEEVVRRLNAELQQGIAELQTANEALSAARRAALNLMEDAVRARKQAEEASADLRQSEERYRGLVELSPEGVFVNRNDRIVLVNPAALQLFGASRAEQLLGKSPFELFHPDLHAVMRERIGRVLAGLRVPVLEEKIVRLDGLAVDVEVVASPVTDHGEQAVQVLLRDITERKRAQAALRQTTEDLQRSNRDLEQFAYAASHDLQEPLRAIGGYVKLLEHRFPDRLDAKARAYIAGAFDGATRMERLISDLLAFSRVATRGDALLPADLEDALEQALRNLEAAISSTQAAVTHDPLPTLSVDAGQIRQVFQNLVGNALKFHGEQPPKIHIAAQRQEGRWVFSVRDNGIGIDAQYYEKIFHIFQRLHTRKDYPGTGIGLAICKKIIERHGGTIWVESQPGQGATFYFSIPEPVGAGQPPAEHR